MSGVWLFRYLDKQQNAKQSRSFSTKELALREACSLSRQGFTVTSMEGPGVSDHWSGHHEVVHGPQTLERSTPARRRRAHSSF